MGGTVLIVRTEPLTEDDALVDALEGCGYTVSTVEDPKLGIFHLRQGCIDCVVVDSPCSADDPGLSAFLLELADASASPPLVLVSDSPTAPSVSARWGAAAFVPKPYNASDIGPVFARMARQSQTAMA